MTCLQSNNSGEFKKEKKLHHMIACPYSGFLLISILQKIRRKLDNTLC